MAGPHKPPYGTRDPRLARTPLPKSRPTPPPAEPELDDEESAMPERTIVAALAPVESFPPKSKPAASPSQAQQRPRPTPPRAEPGGESQAAEEASSEAAKLVPSAGGAAPSAGELERLRDILFGQQTREAEQRLADVESGLEALRQELTDAMAKEIEEAAAKLRGELSALSDELADARGEAEQLRQKLEKTEAELSKKLQAAESAARERDDELQQTLAALATEIEEKTVSRHELGHLLQDLGQRVRGKGKSGS